MRTPPSRPRPSPRRPPSPRAQRARGATYLYAVLARAEEPPAGDAPAGPPGTGALRWLRVESGLWLAAAGAPLDRYGAAAIEKGLRDLEWVSACALAHERVVEHVARLGAAVPMKLFTLFTTDARALSRSASAAAVPAPRRPRGRPPGGSARTPAG